MAVLNADPSLRIRQSAQPADSHHPFTEAHIGHTELTPTYRIDLRQMSPDVFHDNSVKDWGALKWDKIGRPYRVERWSDEKKQWEREHDQSLPVKTAWEMF